LAKLALQIESLTSDDLGAVVNLQPEGWSDILPSIQFYCNSDFCFPLKATLDNKLVGIGTAITHGYTAWLAHIIVDKGYRNSGIGTAITQALINFVQRTPCQSILLIATALGEPVYKKAGFETETEYLFFEKETFQTEAPTNLVTSFEKKYESNLFELDCSVSGEDRRRLFADHLVNAQLFIEDRILKGFYLPTLGDGLIIADTPEAGLELMKMRSAVHQKFCFPIENQRAINYLNQQGFREFRRASRMILGKGFSWKPSKIYSRIGGNLG
jgi:GNAT superfamily N-acetyltransferase